MADDRTDRHRRGPSPGRGDWMRGLGRLFVLKCLVFLTACTMTAEPLNLSLLERNSSPNNALACPPGICVAQADIDSPTFTVTLPVLMETVGQVIAAQPRTEQLGQEQEANRMVFVQRTKVLGFKDTIWVQGTEVEDGSSLIMYSRSNVGYYDFGVNRARLQTWIAAINDAFASAPAGNGEAAES